MCVACSLADGLGKMMAENRQKSRAQIGRRQFLGSAFAIAGAAGASSLGLSSLAGCSSGGAAPSKDGLATVAFTNGAVYTMATSQPWAEAVAINGTKIVAVGSTASVQEQIGPKTQVIDLKGQMLMPGFIEGHTHPLLGGFFTSGVDLQSPTLAEALDAIKQYAEANPTGALRGFGWRLDMFPDGEPTKEILDAVVPDRPVMLFSIDVHSMWCNSKALQVANITAATPDPIPGFSYFKRDGQNNPTGYVLEVVAELIVANAVEPVTVQTMAKYFGDWLPKASQAGITTLFDAAVPPVGGGESDMIQIYADYETKGQLPLRVVACHAAKGPADVDTAVSSTLALQAKFNTELVQARVLKIVADGTEEGFTAYMLEDYSDRPGFKGTPPFTQAQMNLMATNADLAGVDIHVHACGDATVRMALDAIQAAIAANPKRDRRNTIAHNVLVDDADIPRFAELGVNAEFSPNWHSYDPDTVNTLQSRIGTRQAKIYRPNAVLQAGGRISMGTDWPAAGYYSTYKPLDAVQIGVTRKLLRKTESDPMLEPASEKLQLADALTANTLGAAHQLKMEDKVGSIEVGKLADLIVLQNNLFEISQSTIASTPIVMTMLNGAFVHQA